MWASGCLNIPTLTAVEALQKCVSKETFDEGKGPAIKSSSDRE